MGSLLAAKSRLTGLCHRLGLWRPFLSFCPVKEFAEKITKKELRFPVGGGRPWFLGATDLIYCLTERRGESAGLLKGVGGSCWATQRRCHHVPSKAARPWERSAPL